MDRFEFMADLVNDVGQYLHEAGIEKIWRKQLKKTAKVEGVILTEEELDDMELGRFISDAVAEDFEED